MGSVGCWETVDVELINQHSLCQGGQFNRFLQEENSEQRFGIIYLNFHPTNLTPNLIIFVDSLSFFDTSLDQA